MTRDALGYGYVGSRAIAAGLFTDAFNELSSIATSAADDEAPSLNVTVNAFLNESASIVTLIVDVIFHPHELLSTPLNLGSLPLLSLDVSGVSGLHTHQVIAIQKGAAPPNMTYPEQTISLVVSASTLADLLGGVKLSFRNATTAPFAPNASAMAMREALMALDTVGEIEVFRIDLRDGDGAFAGLEYTVRFYPNGHPAHIGPQPTLELDLSELTLASQGPNRRQLQSLADLGISAGVTTTVEGETPFDPADSSDDAARAQVKADDPIPTNETEADTEAIEVTPVQHICGNGIRSTAEKCDDNNTLGGDGCSAVCEIEEGFHCVSTADVEGGSGVGGLDACYPVCGDGMNIPWSSLDECDDNNTISGDGCSDNCTVEPGFECSGGSMTASDTCSSVCGDGLRVGAEACDDGNRVSFDGCDANCAIEAGFTCSDGSASSADTCVACHASCATCTGPLAIDCATCAASFPFFNAPGSCLASCLPVGKYSDSSNVCQPCDPACGTCDGASSSDCVSCTSASTPFLSSGTCVAECPSTGMFSGTVGAVATCIACDATCLSCSGAGSTDCLSCPATGTPLFDEGACVSGCPSGKFTDASSVCKACDSSCGECSNGNATDCTACFGGAAFDPTAGTCTFDCPVGQYLLSDGQTCAACEATCRTCSGNNSTCTSCDQVPLWSEQRTFPSPPPLPRSDAQPFARVPTRPRVCRSCTVARA